MARARNTVLFDFDGVIADSFDACFGVQQLIHPGVSVDQYRQAFNGNIFDWHENFFQSKVCQHGELGFDKLYVSKMRDEIRLVPGMHDAVLSLAGQYTLVIVSSTVTDFIRYLLQKYELTEYFSDVMGGDMHQSKVEKMKAVFAGAATPEHSVFVTDTLGDIKEAGIAGVRAIGVEWGFQNREVLASGNPVCIVERPGDLPAAISDYFRS